MRHSQMFSSALAEIRFGYGLSPRIAPPASVDDMLARLSGVDQNAKQFAIPGLRAAGALSMEHHRLIKARNALKGQAGYGPADEAVKAHLKQMNRTRLRWAGQVMLRRCAGQDGFRERLVAFWGDHFTALGKNLALRPWATPYVHTDLRPLVTGRFADLLTEAVMHPLMVHYLDQSRSFGPESPAGRRLGKGLNENLAREVLELHSLGVDGPYTQGDVQQLAELFTGLGFQVRGRLSFKSQRAEPGAEEVLGQSYGPEPGLAPMRAALEDLARHPATARHLAQKLAVHFIADTPPEPLITALETAYLQHDTALLPVYETLLRHPVAWQAELKNVKPPLDFITSALRALDVGAEDLSRIGEKEVRQLFVLPLRALGQAWERPEGPDGWPEEDTAWLTPQGLATRLRWAMAAPARLRTHLPEPSRFATDVLGPFVDDRVRFAAAAAETRQDGIGLVLMSPAFNRR